ncbi:hypothetical protein RhiirA4_415555 [Rhizophagus irregularis]|uniref:ZSWIM1/3 RNaseH-like domain-containing protein n=1 Tax=Rhizophagus irregularis TaxID=588596 RepID=A0A2I1G0A8_9GLOM|nr:hypothetical protein RhiirA4_415555 [Rhizophagus irregularis]
MSKQLFVKILEIDTNEYLENDLTGIDFNCNISIDMMDDDPKKLSKMIIDLISESDGYYYIYKDSYTSKKASDILIFRYKCSQFNLQHSIIHKRPERFGVNENIKEEIRKNIHLTPSDIYRILEHDNPNLTQKQVHAWWSMLIKQEYIRDDKNQLNSAEVLLNEYGYKTLLNNTKDGVKFLSFTTPFFEKMIETQEIVVDATYKTNVLGYELYAIIGQFDGSGFAMAYLFVEGSKKSDGARTEILTLFFRALYDLGMKNIQFFLTDKDFAQISAAQQIWPHALRSKIIEILEIHMHRHSLIPNINGYHLSAEEIWRESAYEMYEFCFGNDLRNVWAYLWTNWYKKEIWILWAHSAIPEKICMFRTTMLSESHWKVIKRDYLPKFFRPRLDLVIYVLLTRLIPHHQQQYNKYLCGREKPSW